MANYEWEIDHRCNDEEVIRQALNDSGFIRDSDDDYLYKQKIREWKNVEVRIKSDQVLKVTLHWMGNTTTETYFDYLIHSGMKIGMLISKIERKVKENEELLLLESEDDKEHEEGEDDESSKE
jgi:hypothetical protein